jgi:hypothetical protein
MSDAAAGSADSATGPQPVHATDWLGLAAAPALALMALLTAIHGGEQTAMICSAAGLPSFGGMAPMYLLMSAIHASPWLRLVARRLPATWVRPRRSA